MIPKAHNPGLSPGGGSPDQGLSAENPLNCSAPILSCSNPGLCTLHIKG